MPLMPLDFRSGIEPILLLLAKPETLYLTGACTRQGLAELNGARVLIRCDALLNEVLQHSNQGSISGIVGLEHHERLDDRAAFCIGRANYGALRHGRMREQGSFDLRPGDVVARCDDHVVCARLEPEVAIPIHQVGITGEVPPMLNIGTLALISQVATAGWPLHSQSPNRVGRQQLTLLVQDTCLIAWHDLARGAGAHFGAGGSDEDVQHLAGADAIDYLDTGRFAPHPAWRNRQRLTRGNALSQRRDVKPAGKTRHLAIEERTGPGDGRAIVSDGCEQALGRQSFYQDRCSSH